VQKQLLGGFVMALSLATCAGGGQVAYKVTTNGETTTTVVDITEPGQVVEVSLGTLVGPADIHLYDIVAGDTVDDVGTILVAGTNVGEFPVRLAVAAASLSSVSAAFSTVDGALPPGLRNLGGIQFSNAQLRDSARLNVCVRGDITGDIAAGQLFRIQALRDANNTYGGTISGNLTATLPDRDLSNEVLTIEPAIGQVWAGWELSGIVSAWGAPPFVRTDRETWGSVDRIVVDSGIENAVIPGLTGNLNLPLGFIRDIVCAGPIGRGPEANLRSTITAGVRIGRITIRRAESVGDDEVLAYPIFADIEASATGTVDPAFSRLSSLTLIETEDHFVGSLHLVNFSGVTGEVQRTSLRRGIFVGGDFVGSITVDYCYEYGDMIARSFRGPIWIGQLLKGAIVAVGTGGSDPLDGTIDSVEVGYGTIEGSPLPDNGMGFCATIGNLPLPPFENSSRDNWYTLPASDISTVDSVIRADRSIGT